MSTIDINVQPIIEMIRSKVANIGTVRALKGIGKNAGHFLIVITMDVNRDLKIKINVEEMLTNKDYLKTLIKDIYALKEESDKRRFEQCRITV